jgi:hypothetical protein
MSHSQHDPTHTPSIILGFILGSGFTFVCTMMITSYLFDHRVNERLNSPAYQIITERHDVTGETRLRMVERNFEYEGSWEPVED